MASPENHIKHVQKWEGYSKKTPTILPGDPGGLTFRGITYNTWKMLAPRIGADPSDAGFRAMTPQQWKSIYLIFWNRATNNNTIQSQAIANLFFEAQWFGGQQVKKYQTLLREKYKNPKVKSDGAVGPLTVAAVNLAPQSELYNDMLEISRQHYTGQIYEKGLMNRLNELIKNNAKYLAPGGILLAALVLIIAFNA